MGLETYRSCRLVAILIELEEIRQIDIYTQSA